MNNVSILPLFSTPVYFNNLKTTNEALEYLKTLEYLPGVDCLITKHTYLLDEPELLQLKNNIEIEINNFLINQLNFTNQLNYKITTSWVILHNEGHFAPLHIHHNSLYSGVVYLQCDNDSGRISFLSEGKSPLYPSEINIEIENYNIFNSTKWSYLPKQNDIIIFPSHLKHTVEKNNSNKNRYVISFNIFPVGIIGKNQINELVLR